MTATIQRILPVAAVALWTLQPSEAAAAPCRDIPMRVTLYTLAVVNETTGETVPTALQPDGAGEYVNGTSASALIFICGTKDAVVNLNVKGSKRRFRFGFGAPLPGSVVDNSPSWVPGQYLVTGWINVRNILFSKEPFTTRLGSTFTGPDGSVYRLGFHADGVDAPDLHSDLAAMDNTPYPTSPVVVYPMYPAVCGPGAMPTWIVRGTSPNSNGMMQVATLHKKPTRGDQIHSGQYSMPFELRIEALQCFAY
jgi:hypothetical protein